MARDCRVISLMVSLVAIASSASAQDLGPNVRKIKEGIYVQSAREVNSTVGIILTSEGVVLVDTGQTLVDARQVAEAVKKLTPLPVRFVINTEVHPPW
jgi:glyoxylase-like metal-dependent hydrolase (beta-lactamase superfamily II)